MYSVWFYIFSFAKVNMKFVFDFKPIPIQFQIATKRAICLAMFAPLVTVCSKTLKQYLIKVFCVAPLSCLLFCLAGKLGIIRQIENLPFTFRGICTYPILIFFVNIGFVTKQILGGPYLSASVVGFLKESSLATTGWHKYLRRKGSQGCKQNATFRIKLQVYFRCQTQNFLTYDVNV